MQMADRLFTENIAKQAQSLPAAGELDHDSGVQPMPARKELSALKEGELFNLGSGVVFGESWCAYCEITWDVIC
jgi:hypothetical protein